MALAIYKPGQGYYTRTLSCVGFGLIAIFGALWLWEQVDSWGPASNVDGEKIPGEILGVATRYWQYAFCGTLLAGFALALYYAFGRRQNVVDFTIATEAEMKKVNWPTQKEVIGSTWIVIAGTLLLAALLAVVDLVFGFFFKLIGVLQ